MVKVHIKLSRALLTVGLMAVLTTVGCGRSDSGRTAPTVPTSQLPSGTADGTSATSVPSSIPTSTTPGAATNRQSPTITGDGALLTPPSQPSSRSYDDRRGCQSLADDGWSAQCEVLSSPAGKAAWLVEYQGAGGVGDESVPKRALLYRSGPGNRWTLALRASDDAGSAWESVAARTADVEGDNTPKAIYSFALRSGNSTRVIDIAEASGEVVLHLQVDRAVARLAPGGGIEYWTPANADTFQHRLIRYENRAWRIVVSEEVATDRVPRLVPTSPGRL